MKLSERIKNRVKKLLWEEGKPSDRTKAKASKAGKADQKSKSADSPKARRRARIRERRIAYIMKKTGWDHDTAAADLKSVRRLYGISNKKYMEHKFYMLSPELRKETAEDILRAEGLKKRRKEECIEAAMNEMGWTRSEALANLKYTHKELGIPYSKYKFFMLYRVAPEEQYQEYRIRLRQLRQKRAEKAEHYEDIMARNGWTKKQLEEELSNCVKKCNCTFSEFWQYRLDSFTDEELADMMLMERHKRIRATYPNDPAIIKTAQNKEATNVILGKYLKRPWCMNDVTFEEFEEKFKDSPGIVYKPVFGQQARGVELYRFSEHTMREVYDIVTSYNRGVLEEQVIQHPDIMRLNPSSVNCVRLETVSSIEKPVTSDGRMADVIGATLKMGGGDAVVDNLHAGGGVCAGINMETGIIDTDGVDWTCGVHLTHPATGTPIRGFRVPYFKEVKELALEIVKDLKIFGVFGWDIAIREDGPVLIELNSYPDPTLLNIPYAAEHKGLLHRLDKYNLNKPE